MTDKIRQPLELRLSDKAFTEVHVRASEYGMSPEEFASYLVEIGLGVVPSLNEAGSAEFLVLKLPAGSRDALEMGGGSAEQVATMMVESQLQKARPPRSLTKGLEKTMSDLSSPATSRESLELIAHRLRYWRTGGRKE